MILKIFYKTQEAFEELHAKLKLYPCPHCNHTGYLILHGKLYGFTESDTSGKIKKGHRIFCSNKKKKNGCGRTVSIRISGFIKNHIISAGTVSDFLDNIKDGKSLAEANRDAGNKMKGSNVYLIFKKFQYNQVRIRTLLLRIKAPPFANNVKNAVIQTILHLKSVFKENSCPVSQFQYDFQTSFF
ncbi:MAG: hypothetical protein GY714_00645 [Desulfobacterales bacterium]|nr:hypothetical protein [Desulfobacterales bacterium]